MEEEETPELTIDDENDLEIDEDEEDEIDLTNDIEEWCGKWVFFVWVSGFFDSIRLDGNHILAIFYGPQD